LSVLQTGKGAMSSWRREGRFTYCIRRTIKVTLHAWQRCRKCCVFSS